MWLVWGVPARAAKSHFFLYTRHKSTLIFSSLPCLGISLRSLFWAAGLAYSLAAVRRKLQLVSINVWPFSLIESFPYVTIRQITRQVLHDMLHFMSHPQHTSALYAFWGRSQWRVRHETYAFVSHALIFWAVRCTLRMLDLLILISVQDDTRGNTICDYQ